MDKVQFENSSGLSEIDPSDYLIPTKDEVDVSFFTQIPLVFHITLLLIKN
jgi:hypothetical protein